MFNLFKKNYFVLSMSKAQQNIENDPSIVVVDVRTPEEYKSGHIPKALSIPLDRIDSVKSKIKDMDAVIYVYCMSGARSSAACDYLSKVGYTNVTNIGGVGGWKGSLKH